MRFGRLLLQQIRKHFPKNTRVMVVFLKNVSFFFFFKKHNNCVRIKNLHFFSHILLKFYAMNARRMQTFCDTYNKSRTSKKTLKVSKKTAKAHAEIGRTAKRIVAIETIT